MTMPDLDIKEAATRKLGPLPTWGWGIAIVGAVVVYKLIGGRGASSGGGGLAGVDAGIPATGDDGGILDGPNSLWSQIQEQITGQGETITEQGAQITEQGGLLTEQGTALTQAQQALQDALEALEEAQGINTDQSGLITGLTGQIGNLSGFQELQTKLITALNNRATLLQAAARIQADINWYYDQLRVCKTAACKKTNNNKIAALRKEQTANKTALAAIEKVIADLQKLLSGSNGVQPPPSPVRPTPIVSGR